ncbi:hypothetical protein V5O48_008229 [Marasmius crinis-equi]|uniref:Duf1665 domain containing protein n=1 Tax=Marasmius crinis-equi TaxID=585013 RepID=A0ABR3FF99_9AGAR
MSALPVDFDFSLLDPALLAHSNLNFTPVPQAHEEEKLRVGTSSIDTNTKLPGFGLPLTTLPETFTYSHHTQCIERTSFPNALTSWNAPNLLLRELKMLAIINELTEKEGWVWKVYDKKIVAKWKEEALREPQGVSEKMFEYCIEELKDKSVHCVHNGRVAILDTHSGAAVIISDSAISVELLEELKAALSPLEDVPERLKDWHPGSNNKVLDLVHPSLYPLMYGRSRILAHGRATLDDCLDKIGEGFDLPYPDPSELERWANTFKGRPFHPLRAADSTKYWSTQHQWLPCEISFRDSTSEDVEITSYINNLHPIRHRALYTVLEKIITKTIPLWNDCLSYYDLERSARVSTGGQFRRFMRNGRVVRQPEPRAYEVFDPQWSNRVDLRRDWKEQGLQIIVKLANIELRPGPEEGTYEGGSWHVEGQLNEHICASAIYYYEQSNVTESRLAFRQRTTIQDVGEEFGYSFEEGGHQELYGIHREDACIQCLGSVLTKEGRILAFPNVLQHRVEPFELSDPSKPGYRKILALFLVDPYVRTLSTANVPPQQRDWWEEVLRKERPTTRLGRLPVEVFDQVLRMVDGDAWPISQEQAKKVRENLMEERSAFAVKVNRDYEQVSFSFCEH